MYFARATQCPSPSLMIFLNKSQIGPILVFSTCLWFTDTLTGTGTTLSIVCGTSFLLNISGFSVTGTITLRGTNGYLEDLVNTLYNYYFFFYLKRILVKGKKVSKLSIYFFYIKRNSLSILSLPDTFLFLFFILYNIHTNSYNLQISLFIPFVHSLPSSTLVFNLF